MAFRLNDPLRNRLADSMGSAFDGGTLALYVGAQPATPATAPSGTLLSTIALPADCWAAAVGGVAAKAGVWTDTVDASGLAGWGRFTNVGDTMRMDVAVGVGTGEIQLDNANLVAGGTVTVNTCTITQPAA